MLRLIIVLLVVAVALLRGGSLRRIAELRLRWISLLFASLGIQLLIFTPFRDSALVTVVTVQLYLTSMALLVIWVALNRSVPGIALIAAGVLMNLAGIAANDGYMPVDPLAARYAGTLDIYADGEIPIVNNSNATTEGVRLWILTDIFPVPAGIPFATVYSLGDILLTTGAALLCYRTLTTAVPAGQRPAELQEGPLPGLAATTAAPPTDAAY